LLNHVLMQINGSNISDFYIAGVSYKKIEAETRGQFAISPDQYQSLMLQAPKFAISQFFVLSTCNRTEIYGFSQDADHLINLLCSQTVGTAEAFCESGYIKRGEAAIKHLFEVGAGLDSQILGDYEIIGQIKSAVKISKQNGYVGAFLERLVNAVLQSSKAVKNQTALSGGTVSVSFAAVQYIRENITAIADKKILLIGTGKIGRSTCKNLVDYLNTENITLINRTPDKAKELADELGVAHGTSDQIAELAKEADIILVATNAEEPVLLTEHLTNSNQKWIIDLSVPCNVEKSAALLNHVRLINVDELSKLKDETLARRQAEVPKAVKILNGYIEEFLEWYEMRKHVPVLKAVKTKLQEIQSCKFYLQSFPLAPQKQSADQKIQRVINGMASKLRVQNHRGCHYIEAINEYIATGSA
jgi:glutamyl-tRNA reductase